MATTMITIKLESDFLKEIDAVLKDANYQNRTEFIREALREKLQETRVRQIQEHFARIRKTLKKRVTDEEYEAARSKLPDEIDSEELFRLVGGRDITKH